MTSQVRFTGERIPISTYLLLTEKSFFQELCDEFIQGQLLGIRCPGGELIPATSGREEVGGKEGASCSEEEARSPAVVKQKTEPLLPRAAGRMQLYACRSHLVNPADAVDCEFLNLDFLKDTRLLCAACFNCLNFCFHVILLSFCVAPFQDALWYVSFYCNGSANKYNADLQSDIKRFTTNDPDCIHRTVEKSDIIRTENKSLLLPLCGNWQQWGYYLQYFKPSF